MIEFDPQEHGLESHYAPEQQARIRRLMLEDWKETGVKLPTYMKLVARFIEKTGIPEEYLSKLSHQTMSKMLTRTSTPRYEFWAALHLYLSKKYDNLDISTPTDETDKLGQALVLFGEVEEAVKSAKLMLGNTELALEAQDNKLYLKAIATTVVKSEDPFGVEVEHMQKGVAIRQAGRFVAILRDCTTREVSTVSVEAMS